MFNVSYVITGSRNDQSLNGDRLFFVTVMIYNAMIHFSFFKELMYFFHMIRHITVQDNTFVCASLICACSMVHTGIPR